MGKPIRATVTDELMAQLEGYQVKLKASNMSGVIEQMWAHCERTGFSVGLGPKKPVEGTGEPSVFDEGGEEGNSEQY